MWLNSKLIVLGATYSRIDVQLTSSRGLCQYDHGMLHTMNGHQRLLEHFRRHRGTQGIRRMGGDGLRPRWSEMGNSSRVTTLKMLEGIESA